MITKRLLHFCFFCMGLTFPGVSAVMMSQANAAEIKGNVSAEDFAYAENFKQYASFFGGSTLERVERDHVSKALTIDYSISPTAPDRRPYILSMTLSPCTKKVETCNNTALELAKRYEDPNQIMGFDKILHNFLTFNTDVKDKFGTFPIVAYFNYSVNAGDIKKQNIGFIYPASSYVTTVILQKNDSSPFPQAILLKMREAAMSTAEKVRNRFLRRVYQESQ